MTTRYELRSFRVEEDLAGFLLEAIISGTIQII